jgi:hypothetical protein
VGGVWQHSERYRGASQPLRERIHHPFLARHAERNDAFAVDGDLFGRARPAQGQSYESNHPLAKSGFHSPVVSKCRNPPGSGEGAMRRAQQDSMTIQEFNDLTEHVAAQRRVREREETELLGWMLDQQEHRVPMAQQDGTTVQELNELIERAAAQPGVRKQEETKLLGWMLDQQEYQEDGMTSQEVNELIERTAA